MNRAHLLEALAGVALGAAVFYRHYLAAPQIEKRRPARNSAQ